MVGPVVEDHYLRLLGYCDAYSTALINGIAYESISQGQWEIRDQVLECVDAVRHLPALYLSRALPTIGREIRFLVERLTKLAHRRTSKSPNMRMLEGGGFTKDFALKHDRRHEDLCKHEMGMLYGRSSELFHNALKGNASMFPGQSFDEDSTRCFDMLRTFLGASLYILTGCLNEFGYDTACGMMTRHRVFVEDLHPSVESYFRNEGVNDVLSSNWKGWPDDPQKGSD